MAKSKQNNDNTPTIKWSPIRVLFWMTILAAWAVYLLWTYFPPRPEVVENLYSRGVYRAMLTLFTTFTSLTNSSLALWGITLAVLAFFSAWIGQWIYRRRSKQFPHWRGLFWGFKAAFVLIPFLLIAFLLCWGMGYQRMPVEKRLNLDTAPISDAEAGQLRSLLLAVILRDMPPPENRDVQKAVASIALAMSDIVSAWDKFPIRLPQYVKATPKGLLLSNGTSGVCSPLTLEPHVDGALPDAAFVDTAAHELAHIAGMCGEADASFLGYAAAMKSDNPFARYAVALSMYVSLAGSLSPDQRRAAMSILPPEALEDLKKERDVCEFYRIKWFQKFSWRLYNSYLKSQGVAEGVKDYARGMTLFIEAWRKGLAEIPAQAPPVIPQAVAPAVAVPQPPPVPVAPGPEEKPLPSPI